MLTHTGRSMRRRVAVLFGAVAVAMTCWVVPANAAYSLNHGNYAGSTVDFLNVTEANIGSGPIYTPPPVGVVNDALQFFPSAYKAQSSGGAIDLLDGTLQTRIDAKPGYFIDIVNSNENGDFTFVGITTPATSAVVFGIITITVTEIDGVPVSNFPLLTESVGFSSGGDYYKPTDTTIVSGPAGIGFWSGTKSTDVDAFVQSQPGFATSHATALQYSLNNVLITTSEVGTVAAIAKKGLSVEADTIAIPEPTAIALVVVFLPLLARGRRKMRDADSQ